MIGRSRSCILRPSSDNQVHCVQDAQHARTLSRSSSLRSLNYDNFIMQQPRNSGGKEEDSALATSQQAAQVPPQLVPLASSSYRATAPDFRHAWAAPEQVHQAGGRHAPVVSSLRPGMPSYALPGCEDAHAYQYRPSTAPARVQPRRDGRYDMEPRVISAQRVGAMQRLSLTSGDHVSTHSNSALPPLPQAHSQPPHNSSQQQGTPAPGTGYTRTPFSASSRLRHTNAQLHVPPQAAAPAPGARSHSAGYVPPGHAGNKLQGVIDRPGSCIQPGIAATAPPPLLQHRSLGSSQPLPAGGSQSTAPAEHPRRELQHDVNMTGQLAATPAPACLAAQAHAAEPLPKSLSRSLGGEQEPARTRASGVAGGPATILGLSCYGTDSQSTGAQTRSTWLALCVSAVMQYVGRAALTC